jgi:hypothetical protein
MDGKIEKYDGSSWEYMFENAYEGKAIRIAIFEEIIFIVTDSGDIYRCDSSARTCEMYTDQKASDIAISHGEDGIIWILTNEPV